MHYNFIKVAVFQYNIKKFWIKILMNYCKQQIENNDNKINLMKYFNFFD